MFSLNLLFRLNFRWDTFVSMGGHRLYFIFANAMKLESGTHTPVSRGDRGSGQGEGKRKGKTQNKASLIIY